MIKVSYPTAQWQKCLFLLFVLMAFYGITNAQTPEVFSFTVENENYESLKSKAYICKQKYQKEGCRIEFINSVHTLENGYVSEMQFLLFELNLAYVKMSSLEHEYGINFPMGKTAINMSLGFENDTHLHKAVSVERSGQTISFSTNTHNFENEHKVDAETFLSTLANNNITEISFIAQMDDIYGYPDLVSWEWKLNTFKTAPTIKAMIEKIAAEMEKSKGKNGANSNSNSGGNAKVDWRTLLMKIYDHATHNYNNGDKYKGQINNINGMNQRCGLGLYRWNDGCYYCGGWLNNDRMGYAVSMFVGKDIDYCPNSMYYVGYYCDGLKCGKGRCYDKDGNLIYYGDFSNDRPAGTYPSTEKYSRNKFECIEYDGGHKYVGETQDGKRHGYGILLWSNGTAWYGPWVDGIRKGFGIEMYYDGSVKYGRWSNDTYYEK